MRIERTLLAAAVLLGCLGFATAASASLSYSYTGTLPGNDPDAFALVRVVVPTGQTQLEVTSFGYAGGTNGEGTVIAPGGFDAIVSLFDSLGDLISDDDDGRGVVDPATGLASDPLLTRSVTPGTYFVAISAYSNVNLGSILDGFSGGGSFLDRSDVARSTAYAFDVVLTPVPGALALMLTAIAGAGVVRARHRFVQGQSRHA